MAERQTAVESEAEPLEARIAPEFRLAYFLLFLIMHCLLNTTALCSHCMSYPAISSLPHLSGTTAAVLTLSVLRLFLLSFARSPCCSDLRMLSACLCCMQNTCLPSCLHHTAPPHGERPLRGGREDPFPK